MSGQRRLSATAERPRRHLRVIRGRPLVEQLALCAVLELEALRDAIEHDPRSIREVLLTIVVSDSLVERVTVALERAETLCPSGAA